MNCTQHIHVKNPPFKQTSFPLPGCLLMGRRGIPSRSDAEPTCRNAVSPMQKPIDEPAGILNAKLKP